HRRGAGGAHAGNVGDRRRHEGAAAGHRRARSGAHEGFEPEGFEPEGFEPEGFESLLGRKKYRWGEDVDATASAVAGRKRSLGSSSILGGKPEDPRDACRRSTPSEEAREKRRAHERHDYPTDSEPKSLGSGRRRARSELVRAHPSAELANEQTSPR